MVEDKEIVKLITKVVESRGLFTSISHLNGESGKLYNIEIFGIEYVTTFEFNWCESDNEISFHALFTPEFKSISNKRYQEIEEIFKGDIKVMESISMRKDGTLISINGSFTKSIYSEAQIEEIIDYFNEPSLAIKKLYELTNK